jgi:hypothetical protein
MRINPAVREIVGTGVNGSGHHMFACLSCRDGSVAYGKDGKRRDHVRKIPADKPWRHAFEISTYCPDGKGVHGWVIVNDDYNAAYSAAVRFAHA